MIFKNIMEEEVECNMCGNLMFISKDKTVYICVNSECTRYFEEE